MDVLLPLLLWLEGLALVEVDLLPLLLLWLEGLALVEVDLLGVRVGLALGDGFDFDCGLAIGLVVDLLVVP